MDSGDQPRVAVVGAAGFVGRVLLRQLEERGIKVAAVVRGAAELSVDGDFHVAVSEPSRFAGSFDLVVNLAYPTSGPGHEYRQKTIEIAQIVQDLVKDGGRLIQVSTLAVFGMALDRPVSPGPVAETRDSAYVESKVLAELLLTEQQAERRLSLDIVRLGNVWGSASGNWAVSLVHRLITGRPVGIRGAVAHSNTTDVANAASYLAFLIESEDRGPGVRYHHLAEFSEVSWNAWLSPMAEALGVVLVYAERSAIDGPVSARDEAVAAVAAITPRSLYRTLSQERITGSWSRTLVSRLPAVASARLKSSGEIYASEIEYSRADQTFLAIMAGRQEFRSVLQSGWEPPLNEEQSLDGVLRWLARDWTL